MKIFLIAILVTFSNLTFAQQPWAYATKHWQDSPFVALSPPFCIDPTIDWRKKFGRSMTWSNHFCHAYVKIHICRSYFGNDKIACLKNQEEGFTYWIKHAQPGFKLLPTIHSKYGDLLNEIGDTNRAIIEYKNALNENPKYIKAYQGLIDSYIKVGLLKEAKKTVNTALQIKESKSLLKRKNKIDKLLSQ